MPVIRESVRGYTVALVIMRCCWGVLREGIRAAYESQLNPSGNAGIRNNANTETGNWYQNPTAIRSQSDAFDRSGGANNPDISTGAIGQTSGRPETSPVFYDGITANDITPLYFSARAVTDRKALLFDNFNRAVAGETFMGAEGTPLTGNTVFTGDQASSSIFCGIGSSIAPVNRDLRFLGGYL